MENIIDEAEASIMLAIYLSIPIVIEQTIIPMYRIIDTILYKRNVYWNRSNMTNIGLNKSTLRKYCKTRMVLGKTIVDKADNTIKGFGFDKSLLSQKNRDFQCFNISDASIVQRKCNIGENDKYTYIEPNGSLTQRKMDAVYLHTDEVMEILKQNDKYKYIYKSYQNILLNIRQNQFKHNVVVLTTQELENPIINPTINKVNILQKLYIITSDRDKKDNYYKIGIAKNIDKRIEKLNSGNPSKLYCLKSFECNNAFKIEQNIHKYYKECRLNSEWFEIENLQECIDYIESIIE